MTRIESFTALLVFTKSLAALLLLLMLIWIGHFRGGYAWRFPPHLQFNWHPILMTAGMIIMYGNAIVVYRALKNTRKYTTKLIHASLNIIGLIFTVIGLVAVFDSHNYAVPPIPNMYSLHSWVGIISVVLFCCQWLAGLITFLVPGMSQNIRALYYPIHVYFGIICFAIATVAAMMGLLEKAIFSVNNYSQFSSEGLLMNCMGITLLLYSVLVTFIVIKPSYKRPTASEDQNLLEQKE